MEWKKVVSENHSASVRYGHTAILYQKKLILFGGSAKLMTNGQYFLQDVEIFNIEDKMWNFPIVFTKSTLKLRKHHVADLLGKLIKSHN